MESYLKSNSGQMHYKVKLNFILLSISFYDFQSKFPEFALEISTKKDVRKSGSLITVVQRGRGTLPFCKVLRNFGILSS